MMIIDEHTSIGDDAGGASARALQCSLPRGMRRTSGNGDVAFASRTFTSLNRWLWHRVYAVSVDADVVSLAGIATHEAAIAKVEQHLHRSHEVRAPASPLNRPTEP